MTGFRSELMDLSDRPDRKLLVAGIVFVVVTLLGALAMSLGASERVVLPALLVVTPVAFIGVALLRRAAAQRPERQRTPVILFLAADPLWSDLPNIDREYSAIERVLQVPHHGNFRFESRRASGIDDLLRSLRELEPTVLHFSGHGVGSSGLMLRDERGQPKPISERTLAMLIQTAAPNVRLVVLNACYTAEQADVLRDNVDCVVGMSSTIGDDAAIDFATEFYSALGHRQSIGNALEQGKASLAMRRLSDKVLPHCLTRDGVDADKIVLGTLPVAA